MTATSPAAAPTQVPPPAVRPALTLADLDQYKKDGRPPEPEYPGLMRTFWSPHDNVHGALKAVIGSCTRSLVVAMYGYDDDEVAELISHLLEDPTIFVQITLDSSQAGGTHEKALLEKYKNTMTGNSVAIGRSERGAIMHRKVALVDGRWRIGGSTNWSKGGEEDQDNELLVIDSVAACNEARHMLDIEHDSILAKMKAAPAA